MQLNYRQNSRGLYILNKNDFDDIATMILSNYQPAMLKKAQPLDVQDLVEEHLYLDMKIARMEESWVPLRLRIPFMKYIAMTAMLR